MKPRVSFRKKSSGSTVTEPVLLPWWYLDEDLEVPEIREGIDRGRRGLDRLRLCLQFPPLPHFEPLLLGTADVL